MRPEENQFADIVRLFASKRWIDEEKAKEKEITSFEEKRQMESIFRTIAGGFAISDDTIFVEFRRRLIKCRLDRQEYTDTGLVDYTQVPLYETDKGFKVAVAAGTVYVGKRNGRLFQSVDNGDSWRDITPNIPAIFTDINDIKFLGKKVYVATDTGVLTSDTGNHWRILTDTNGTQPIIDKLTVDNRTLFGAGNNGIYRIDQRNRWQQLSQPIPGKVISLSVSGNKAYIGTDNNGIYNTTLEDTPHPIITEK